MGRRMRGTSSHPLLRCHSASLLTVGEPAGPHHADVGVGDGEDHGAAKGGGGHGTERVGLLGRRRQGARGNDRVRGEEGREVRLDANGPHAGPAAPVGDAEGLVEVEVAHVRPDVPGGREAHLGVHVGPVHVHLAPVVVDDLADAVHALLVHPERRGIRHHERGQVVLVLLGAGLELLEVDVAVLIRAHRHDLVAHHGRRRGVRAVCRGRDDAHVAVALAAALVVRADRHQARVLAARARVGLQGHGVEACGGRAGKPGKCHRVRGAVGQQWVGQQRAGCRAVVAV